MKTGWALAYGVICTLLAAGALYLITRAPHGQPIQLLPAPTPAPYIVQVSGAVTRPGVYSLAPGSRVKDAIEAAGGFLPDAYPENINLAFPLQDGQQIVVALKGSTQAAPPLAPTSAAVRSAGDFDPAPAALININSATQDELDALPGIGPVLAARIVDYRTAHGPFLRIEDIENVSGIGPALFEKIKALITVNG